MVERTELEPGQVRAALVAYVALAKERKKNDKFKQELKKARRDGR